MEKYVIQFIVYTLAITGVLIMACVVYKKALLSSDKFKNQKSGNLKISDMMRLPDRKMLYVISCRGRDFLIASSQDRVSLISELNGENYVEEPVKKQEIRTNFIQSSLLKELSDKNSLNRGN